MDFCEHMDTYGVQYTKTEAAYRQCNHLVSRIQEDGGDRALVDLLEVALSQWKADNKKLRTEFCSLVEDGKIALPKKTHGHPHCQECGFAIPKLEYSEWKIAHNGVAALNGEELLAPQPA